MKLYYATASPFARKVRVMLAEIGSAAQVELVDTKTAPDKTDGDLQAVNPLGKIPCLILSNGESLYDSRVICEYLDVVLGSRVMCPREGSERWTALRRQAIGDGIMDAGVLLRYESALRPSEKFWSVWYDAQVQKIARSLNSLGKEVDSFNDQVDIGLIACACALSYLDFRFPDLKWREGREGLEKWYSAFALRMSMRNTEPE